MYYLSFSNMYFLGSVDICPEYLELMTKHFFSKFSDKYINVL